MIQKYIDSSFSVPYGMIEKPSNQMILKFVQIVQIVQLVSTLHSVSYEPWCPIIPVAPHKCLNRGIRFSATVIFSNCIHESTRYD